ncbi:conserved hypothetical protein [Leishmania infantum JPCM5]|uniref:Uncharacterized protein n=2 Tax=Leishmania infantum TaxID=5671 RepID=E9AG53_LEIIN|nr:conserved hypothetical protein [Leishmania infantum JPCM5]CAC9439523.1 hypothetical_protein_-_conserved [Leishmania infantum]CBZ08337.1 conserved hypothetical protein [Leishmania infantum JPCM5]SUZ38759.1 hypothetical_protein_-_conserved [Leishmania infantum]|eukprot:XP_003392205.1 conserved hypothetical protein [Leishmania infantum JPCM5]
MLRRTLRCCADVRHTSVPSFMQHPVEMAFYFPRFHPDTHVNAAGIPELIDAVGLMTRHSRPSRAESTAFTSTSAAESAMSRALPPTRWTTTVSATAQPTTDAAVAEAQKDNAKSLLLLERGIDILNSVGGVRNPTVANLLRPLYAARFEMLNGSEHLPRSEYAKRMHVPKAILQQAAPLLYYDAWDKSDVQQLDTSCVLVGHFMKAFCALHPRPFHPVAAPATSGGAGSSQTSSTTTTASSSSSNATSSSSAQSPPKGALGPAEWKMAVGDDGEGAYLTLSIVQDRVEELLRLATAAYDKHGSTRPELRWLRPKLLVLKGLLTIPLTGHLLHAQRCIEEAANYVDALTKRKNLLLDGLKERTHEPELGLYMLLQAEIAARVFDWDVAPGQVDGDVVNMFTDAAGYYADPPNTTLDGDAIMSESKLAEQRFEVEAYTCCLRSYAAFLLGAPRPKATTTRDSPVFLAKQLFSLNPLLTVATSSSLIFSDVRNVSELPLDMCRRRTGEALDRALKLNRMLYPDFRQNAPAASTLMTMACMYADTRDYLYATGLFESANKAVTYNFGDTSLEHVFLQKLRYEFLAGVGSEQEANTASHEVVHLLKRMDALPC